MLCSHIILINSIYSGRLTIFSIQEYKKIFPFLSCKSFVHEFYMFRVWLKKKKLKTEFIDLLRVQTDESAVKMDSLVH